ncbi:ribosome biogenesis GTPase YlqF [Spiroplasma turonicum]|uniref:Ribosome biogenesis GTPase A n=1 Tax=Spiroplasma turonicum TaxID=216946 RepID=A0A0K1P714_9MOLU|nr:ribosome biogenesis GTPase YlqF [Spiroplasma turonicum]AKU80070.1 ribosomal biogenesis GTPase [Spiroplasma turonicum]ALX71072.1 ribosomal biogenesis GTPase [Spiroplasma turonicum]
MNKEKASFNWFPGHMNKTIKDIEATLPIIDLVIEIVDVRAPYSSQNPLLKKLLAKKTKLLVFTKCDIADKGVTNLWNDYYKQTNTPTYFIKNKNSDIVKDIIKKINEITIETQLKQKNKGIENPQLNVMVVGIPNVGKSTFITKLAKGKTAKVGNKPGLTRGLQRFNLTNNINIIDTPGLLPSKFENETVACNCVAINSVKLDLVPKERFATKIMRYIYNSYPSLIENKYNIKNIALRPINYDDTYKIFEQIAIKNNYLIVDDIYDIDRAIIWFINDVIGCKLGELSFEKPIEVVEINSLTLDDIDIDKTTESDLTVEW